MVKHDDLDDLGVFHCHGGTPSSLCMVFVEQIPSFDSWMIAGWFIGENPTKKSDDDSRGTPILLFLKPPFKGYGNFDA